MSRILPPARYWLVIGVLFVSTILPLPIAADVPAAVVYLQIQPADPWITQALVAAGVSNPTTSHLATVSGTLATDYAKTILALASAGEDPATFGAIDFIAKLKTYSDGTQIGDASLLNDDAWAILALSSVGQEGSAEASLAKTFLVSHQNADGGWGYGTSGAGAASDTNDTAAVLMALAEAGYSSTDSVVADGLAYLQSTQNSDGGIPYSAGYDSDAGSDAWVIAALNKFSINPTSWTKGGSNPKSHLESLQDSDGGYWWVTPGTSTFNNKAMTPFAVVALAGKTFPVGYYQLTPPPLSGAYHLRIEGSTSTVCDGNFDAATALLLVEAASQTCGFTYTITTTSFGPYLSAINGDSSQGLTGWLYFVNFASPAVGAADYQLAAGDDVLWYFGDWGWQPTWMSASVSQVSSGQSITFTGQYFDGSNWQPLPNANLIGGDQTYQLNGSGTASLVLPDGQYQLQVESSGYIRSNSVTVAVGDGTATGVDLQVEVSQNGDDGEVLGDSIIFIVTPDQLNFGQLAPGGEQQAPVVLSNEGSGTLNITAGVSGDALFRDNISVDNASWRQFHASVLPNESDTATVKLSIPSGYLGAGVKTGELVFWAEAL